MNFVEGSIKKEIKYEESSVVNHIPPIGGRQKCGEVYIHDGTILYYCLQCPEKNFDIITFEKHINEQHECNLMEDQQQIDNCIIVDTIINHETLSCKLEKNSDDDDDDTTDENDKDDDWKCTDSDGYATEQSKIKIECENPPKIRKPRSTSKKPIIKIKKNKTNNVTSENLENIQDNEISNNTTINKSSKAFPCNLCDRSYSAKKRLKEHLKIHNGEDRLFKCDECGKCLRSSTTLKLHMRIHTGERPFECEICKRSFRAKPGLMNHMLVHTGEKPFACSFCLKRFQTKAHVRIHERIHTGEKPYQCHICGENFASSSRLNEHRKRHLNIRAFPCEECGKSFFNNQQLLLHKIVHTNEKNFICQVCSVSFGRKRSLRQHERTHSGSKDYTCNICGEGFLRYSAVYYHMKSQHEFSPMEYTYNPIKNNTENQQLEHNSDITTTATGEILSINKE